MASRPWDTACRVEALAEALGSECSGPVLFVTHSKVLEAVLAKVFGRFYEGVHTEPGAFFHWDYGRKQLGELHKIECHEHQVEQ